MEHLISQREACSRLGITAPTLRQMIEAGTITSYPGTKRVSGAQIERIRQGETAHTETEEASQ